MHQKRQQRRDELALAQVSELKIYSVAILLADHNVVNVQDVKCRSGD